MIRDLPALLEPLWPAVNPGVISVVCIRTSHPKFLVFTGNATRPTFVVQLGPAGRLERVAQVLARLHPRLPTVVPQSLLCTPWREHEYVQVQTGLPGLPWFRLPQLCATRADWLRLLERSSAVLRKLHAAIRDEPSWRGGVAPAVELAWIIEQSADTLPITELRRARLRAWMTALEDLGERSSWWQHGDFSLNNLLVGETTVGVIDFDEFGETRMPLYDEIGLALSVPLSQGDRCPLTLQDCLQACLLPRATREGLTPAVPALILYHLLARIAACRGIPARNALRSTLTRWTMELLDDPNAFLGTAQGRPRPRTARPTRLNA